eukprot:SAG22_NODE_11_length_35583_cov_107.128790_21_plen_45_part_00
MVPPDLVLGPYVFLKKCIVRVTAGGASTGTTWAGRGRARRACLW